MLQFSEDFFKGESRNDFYVEEMMKKAWAAQMKVLNEIGRVCRKHNITYFADCGTLLGTVRHQGFIPWDDDIDITMKPDDYKRFLKTAAADLPENYKVLSLYTHEKYMEIFARVVNSNKVNCSEEWLNDWYGCPFAVGVDIFPLNYMPEDKDELEIQKKLYTLVRNALKCCMDQTEESEKVLLCVEELCAVTLNREGNLEKQLVQLLESIRTMYDAEGSKEFTKLHTLINRPFCHVPREAYDKAIPMLFEGMEIPVPVGWDYVLKAEFGEDYMTPVRNAKHEYPFYQKQYKQALKKKNQSE